MCLGRASCSSICSSNNVCPGLCIWTDTSIMISILTLTMLLMPLLRVSGAQYARPLMSARGRMAAPRVLLPKSVSCRQAATLKSSCSFRQ